MIVSKHPKFTMEMLGFLPSFINPNDPDNVVKQFDKNYQYGPIYWKPGKDFSLDGDGNMYSRRYRDDPPFILIAECRLRDELIRFYAGAWVAVISGEDFVVGRID